MEQTIMMQSSDKIKWVVKQNFVRHWIEFIMCLIKRQGVDGVICNEHTYHGTNGERSSRNLYIFSVEKITPPDWIIMPDFDVRLAEKKLLKKKLKKDELKLIKFYPYFFSY